MRSPITDLLTFKLFKSLSITSIKLKDATFTLTSPSLSEIEIATSLTVLSPEGRDSIALLILAGVAVVTARRQEKGVLLANLLVVLGNMLRTEGKLCTPLTVCSTRTPNHLSYDLSRSAPTEVYTEIGNTYSRESL